MVAIAMDLFWGFCGILSLGHFAFFALGGYMIGMWLMYARTELIVLDAAHNLALPMTKTAVFVIGKAKLCAASNTISSVRAYMSHIPII